MVGAGAERPAPLGLKVDARERGGEGTGVGGVVRVADIGRVARVGGVVAGVVGRVAGVCTTEDLESGWGVDAGRAGLDSAPCGGEMVRARVAPGVVEPPFQHPEAVGRDRRHLRRSRHRGAPALKSL